MNAAGFISHEELGKRSTLLIHELTEKFPELMDEGKASISGRDVVDFLSERLRLWASPQNSYELDLMLTRLADLNEFIAKEVNHGSYKLYQNHEGFFSACMKVFSARRGWLRQP